MKNRHGFTIVEISFFLAITALIFLGVTMGVQDSIYRQRFNDSVQSFVEFLRGVYGQVTNVQSLGDGRSTEAIYGKLVTFGETKNTLGENNNEKAVFTYDVIGNLEGVGSPSGSSMVDLLKGRGVKVLKEDSGKSIPVGMVESFVSKWSSQIQKKADNSQFVGALLIVRHPRSGNIYTLVREGQTIEVNANKNNVVSDTWFANQLTDFTQKDVDFCIAPDGLVGKKGRADVRIKERASGSAGIETLFDNENRCD